MLFPADDPKANESRPTPLYAAAASLATANSWTSVNGWAAARAYVSVAEEYAAATTGAAFFDLGPLCRYTLRGPDSARLLARLATTPALDLDIGESARGLILDAGGLVVDLVETVRLSGDFFLATTSRPIDLRLRQAAKGYETDIENISGAIAAIGVVGPGARAAAAAAGVEFVEGAVAQRGRARGVETYARLAEFGAGVGVEIIFPAAEALTLWDRVRRADDAHPIGLDALEILRIEGGEPRLDVDFPGADRSGGDGRAPDEIGLPHLAPANRAWFNGRRAVKRPVRRPRYLAVLGVDADAVEPGARVFAGAVETGRIVSSAFSPRLRRALAFAEIGPAGFEKPLETALLARADEPRARAALFDTAESRRAAAFRAQQRAATDSRG